MRLRVAPWLAAAIIVLNCAFVSAQQPTPPPDKKDSTPSTQTIGPLDFSVNWRARVINWDWFKAKTGHGNYTYGESLLRVAIGQRREHFDWFLEGEQVALIDLPTQAVVAAPQGQLGLGANYYAANSNETNPVGGFLKQGYVNFKDFGSSLKIGRFEYFDGNEVKPKDPMLATRDFHPHRAALDRQLRLLRRPTNL